MEYPLFTQVDIEGGGGKKGKKERKQRKQKKTKTNKQKKLARLSTLCFQILYYKSINKIGSKHKSEQQQWSNATS